MIVVVEGPSAAGKTTWIRRHCDPAIVVPGPGAADAVGAGREELIRRRDRDGTRQRHNFDRHLQLAESLAEWYRAIERLGAGRVSWGLPIEGLPGGISRRVPRSGGHLLDALLAGLPAS